MILSAFSSNIAIISHPGHRVIHPSIGKKLIKRLIPPSITSIDTNMAYISGMTRTGHLTCPFNHKHFLKSEKMGVSIRLLFSVVSEIMLILTIA